MSSQGPIVQEMMADDDDLEWFLISGITRLIFDLSWLVNDLCPVDDQSMWWLTPSLLLLNLPDSTPLFFARSYSAFIIVYRIELEIFQNRIRL